MYLYISLNACVKNNQCLNFILLTRQTMFAINRSKYTGSATFHCSELLKTFTNNVASKVNRKRIVLGIETSCDDTGCAIVDESGKILGESIRQQTQIHLQ